MTLPFIYSLCLVLGLGGSSYNAPINVKPQGGGRPGVGGGFDVTSLPVAGTFDHSSSPGGRDF